MNREELNFETERLRCHETAVALASQMLMEAYSSQIRLAQCMGSREFGIVWMSKNIVPRDEQFEQKVLQMFLGHIDGR